MNCTATRCFFYTHTHMISYHNVSGGQSLLREEEKSRSIRKQIKMESIRRWQEEWDASEKGRWTHQLIPNISAWVNRKHSEINFELTQFLSDHRCLWKYLHRFGHAGVTSLSRVWSSGGKTRTRGLHLSPHRTRTNRNADPDRRELKRKQHSAEDVLRRERMEGSRKRSFSNNELAQKKKERWPKNGRRRKPIKRQQERSRKRSCLPEVILCNGPGEFQQERRWVLAGRNPTLLSRVTWWFSRRNQCLCKIFHLQQKKNPKNTWFPIHY